MNSSSYIRPISKMAQIRQQIQPLIASRNIEVIKRNITQQLHREFSSFNYYSNARNVQYSKLTDISVTNIRLKSDASAKIPKDILLYSNKNGVTTLTMNQPKKLNGWTGPMMLALKDAFIRAASDDNTKVAVLTGADPYYCAGKDGFKLKMKIKINVIHTKNSGRYLLAGVNLSDTIKPMHPATLHKMIYESNAAIFNVFIDFQKPLIIAANGPAIGACFTSATLCDCIIASEKATFSTPFARLGVPPEGCSSVHFERIMGKKNADRMLGSEGWIPTASEAKEAGFVKEVVAHDKLLARAQEIGEQIISSGTGKVFAQGHGTPSEYKQVNDEESRKLADAFLAYKFLDAQYNFLKSKGKGQLANVFWILKTFRPLWSWMLPKK